MEDEVALAMKKYLHHNLGPTVIDIPTDIIVGSGKIV
jgi:hypothetical protein